MATKKAAAKKTATRTVTPQAAPTHSDLRRIARAIVTATCMGELDRLLDLYAEGAESEEVGAGQIVRGIANVEDKLRAWAKAHPEAVYHPAGLWCDGQTIIIEWEITLRSKGRKVVLRELALHEIRAGKINRERYYYDPKALA